MRASFSRPARAKADRFFTISQSNTFLDFLLLEIHQPLLLWSFGRHPSMGHGSRGLVSWKEDSAAPFYVVVRVHTHDACHEKMFSDAAAVFTVKNVGDVVGGAVSWANNFVLACFSKASKLEILSPRVTARRTRQSVIWMDQIRVSRNRFLRASSSSEASCGKRSLSPLSLLSDVTTPPNHD
jgi:hypothetical protein